MNRISVTRLISWIAAGGLALAAVYLAMPDDAGKAEDGGLSAEGGGRAADMRTGGGQGEILPRHEGGRRSREVDAIVGDEAGTAGSLQPEGRMAPDPVTAHGGSGGADRRGRHAETKVRGGSAGRSGAPAESVGGEQAGGGNQAEELAAFPVAFEPGIDSGGDFTPEEVAVINAERERFARELEDAPAAADPRSPEYLKHWDRARWDSDNRLRQELGAVGFNKLSFQALQAPEAAGAGAK